MRRPFPVYPSQPTFGLALDYVAMGQRTNPLSREGLAARSGDYIYRSNYLIERW